MDIDKWIQEAKKGESVIYHTGYMAADMANNYDIKSLCYKINEYCRMNVITVVHKCLNRSEIKGTYDYIMYKL